MDSANFHQLRIFHAVATMGSFSRAAEQMLISQPAVSIQVQALERSIGTALFHRTRKGVQLTDAGRTVFGYTQRIFSLADEMLVAVQDIQGLRTGRLTIGSSTTPGEYILPWVIGRFQQQYPGIEVSLSIANTQSVVEKIRSRELDLGMAGAAVSLRGLASFPYVLDDIVIIAAPTHPLAARRKLSVKDLAGQKFILREAGSATRRTAEECFQAHDVSVKVVMDLGSNEAVKGAVAAGLGLGVISKFGVIGDTRAGLIKVLEARGWRCQRPLTVIYRDGEQLPAAQRAFLHFLREVRPLPAAPATPP